MTRIRAAFVDAVPAAWRATVSVTFQLTPGPTSWASTDGLIQVGTYHANGDYNRLRVVLAHEFGHLIAYRWGSQAFLGAAPSGWPSFGSRPQESWADCVSRSFTGIDDPSRGLPSCSGSTFAWTQAWLAPGPR